MFSGFGDVPCHGFFLSCCFVLLVLKLRFCSLFGAQIPRVPRPVGYQATRRMVTEPSQVDLLITIRDDNDDDVTGNLRHSEPSGGNLGSHGSIASGGIHHQRERGTGSPDADTSNATNASILARQIAVAQAQAQSAQAHHAQAAAMLNRPGLRDSPTPLSEAATLPVRGGGDAGPRPVSFHEEPGPDGPPAAAAPFSSSPSSRPASPGRPVDLMVDMVKGGGVLVRSSTPSAEGAVGGAPEPQEPAAGSAPPAGNGPLPRWNRSSPYRQIPSKEGESCV